MERRSEIPSLMGLAMTPQPFGLPPEISGTQLSPIGSISRLISQWAGSEVDTIFVLNACCQPPGIEGWYIHDVQLMPVGIFDDGFESGNLTEWSSSLP